MSIDLSLVKFTDFDKICRICVKKDDIMFEILENHIADMLTACTSVHVSHNTSILHAIYFTY